MENENEIREAFEDYDNREKFEGEKLDSFVDSICPHNRDRTDAWEKGEAHGFYSGYSVASQKLEQKDKIIKTLYDRLHDIYSEKITEDFMIQAKALIDG